MFAAERVTKIAAERRDEFETRILEPAKDLWMRDYASPWAHGPEIEEFADELVRQHRGSRPKAPSVPAPDNSTAYLGITLLILTVLVGISLIAVGFPFLFLLTLAPALWLLWTFIHAHWTTPDDALLRTQRNHERDVALWEEEGRLLAEDLQRHLRWQLHLALAETSGVPKRLWGDFAKRSMERERWFRSQWLDEIVEWSNRPEFPEAPEAVQDGVSPKEYEAFCRDFLVSWGYLDAKVTRYVGDGGVDVVSESLVAQCKHYNSGSVGVREVREIFGVAVSEGKRAVIFTSGKFTREAIEFASKTDVALFLLKETDAKPRAQNEAGKEILVTNRAL